jgi:hypothetical protein
MASPLQRGLTDYEQTFGMPFRWNLGQVHIYSHCKRVLR